MKKVAVLQSNYLPWKGYFDIINEVDLFIFYDDVQYTKNDWRNRNKIKSSSGASWLTIPVGDRLDRLVCEVELKDHRWQKKHWKSIYQTYSKAEYFNEYRDFFEEFFLQTKWGSLSELNQYLIKEIAQRFLGITTEFADSRSFTLQGAKMERLLSLLRQVQADSYLSGPAAKSYLEQGCFAGTGIELRYKEYAGYPEYSQIFPPFLHQVSIIDLLFQLGLDTPEYIWGWRNRIAMN